MSTVVGARAELVIGSRSKQGNVKQGKSTQEVRPKATSAERGRHRLGRPGLAHRRDLGAAGKRRPARHCRAGGRVVSGQASARGNGRVTAARLSLMVAMIAVAVVAVSGWYAASGASAVVQMLAR
jgi:hypothetical protein